MVVNSEREKESEQLVKELLPLYEGRGGRYTRPLLRLADSTTRVACPSLPPTVNAFEITKPL